MPYRSEVTLVTKVLCAAGGSMRLQQLRLLCGSIPVHQFHHIVRNCPRFALLPRPPQDGLRPEEERDYVVVAQTSLRLCLRYQTETCPDCKDLHLCRYYLYGNCKFTRDRKVCRYSHDIHSEHNSPLLRECTLQEISREDLFLMLLQNDDTLLPEICSHYNKGPQEHGSCSFRELCTKVHLCQHFIHGLCLFGGKCRRRHSIDEASRRLLEERGLSAGLIDRLPAIYQNKHRLRLAAAEESCGRSQPDQIFSGDICLHFLRNCCRFQESCELVHFHLPYRWQVFADDSWLDLPHMEMIEEAYCHPSNSQSFGVMPVDFLSMTLGSLPVRRLSTVSSVERPPHYTLTTQWLWYYRRERGVWVQYGEPDDKQRTTSVTSRDLEKAFLSGKTEVKLVKGHREYTVTFSDMYQRNPKNNIRRRVTRRPRYVSPAEVQRLTGS